MIGSNLFNGKSELPVKKYLIYDMGYGEQGCESKYVFYRYFICEGSDEIDAVRDWIRQSPFKEDEVYLKNGIYYVGDGRSWLKIVPLIRYSNEKDTLTWL